MAEGQEEILKANMVPLAEVEDPTLIRAIMAISRTKANNTPMA